MPCFRAARAEVRGGRVDPGPEVRSFPDEKNSGVNQLCPFARALSAKGHLGFLGTTVMSCREFGEEIDATSLNLSGISDRFSHLLVTLA